MFPTNILQGTYNQSNGNNGGSSIPEISSITFSGTMQVSMAEGRYASGSSSDIYYGSAYFSYPTESKRLMELCAYDYHNAGLNVYIGDQNGNTVNNLQAGVILYGNSNRTQLLTSFVGTSGFYGTSEFLHIPMSYNGTFVTISSLTPTDDFVWIKMRRSTNEVIALYSNLDVTSNTLKDVSQQTSLNSISQHGMLLVPANATQTITPYSTYQDALNQNISYSLAQGNIWYGLASESNRPGLQDQFYQYQSNQYDAYFFNAKWYPFVVSSTATSVEYAIELDVSGNIPTANDVFITEIRDAGGNTVTQIT